MQNGQFCICPRCGDLFTTFKKCFSHIKGQHSRENNFSVQCGLHTCPTKERIYFNMDTYGKHIKKHHKNVVNAEPQVPVGVNLLNGDDQNLQDQFEGSSSEEDCTEEERPRKEGIQCLSRLLLKLKEKYHLPDTCLDDIWNDMRFIVEREHDAITQDLQQLLDSGEYVAAADNLKKIVQDASILKDESSSLSTQYRREKYWKENMNVILPTELVLGFSDSGKKECAQYIPIEETLVAFISHDDVWNDINRPRDENHLTDIWDGTRIKTFLNPDDELEPILLQLYQDDFEVCNPLGSKRGKHKLLGMYFTVLNVSPKYRSKLEIMNVTLLVHSTVLNKYGDQAVFGPLVDDLKRLEETGISVNGQRRRVVLAVISGDNLASNKLGGFQMSFLHGRMCRFCMATRNDCNEKFRECDFIMRSKENHNNQVAEVRRFPELAQNYGVKSECIFSSLSNFDATKSFPCDIMHDVLEGVVPIVVKLVLSEIVKENHITLDELNNNITTFQYHFCDISDKPSPLSRASLMGNAALKGTASQKWTMLRLLPMFIGQRVPEDNKWWELYLILRSIVDIAFAPVVPRMYIAYLEELVHDFLSYFHDLFPTFNITPKMHYIVHYPKMIEMYGPIVRLWCMRFESKHQYFKDATQHIRSFINVTKTLAERHQFLMAHIISSDVILDTASEMKGFTTGPKVCLPVQMVRGIEEKYDKTMPDVVSQVQSVTNDCVTYKIGGIYLLGLMNDVAYFVKVSKIVVIDNCFFLFGALLISIYFHKHFHAYVVEEYEKIVVKSDEIVDYHALPLYGINGLSLVNMKYGVFEDQM